MFNDGLSLIISCEHGGTYIPKQFEHLFKGNKRIVNSHFGHDPGARELATTLHRKSRGLLFTSDLSRLICDMNRSPGNPKLFSKFTCCLSAGNKNYIRSHYYEHYRSPIERSIALNIDNGKKVLHISVHTFTPVLDGKARDVDVALLYDPKRGPERGFCLYWQKFLRERYRSFVVRRNYPYRGVSDGLTTFFRKRFPERLYAGIELEVNQIYPLKNKPLWSAMQAVLADSLEEVFSVYSEQWTSNAFDRRDEIKEVRI